MRHPISTPLSFSKRVLAASALILCAALSAHAQTTSTLTGDVRDANGALVPGVAVTAKSLETGAARAVESDTEGRYTFPGLPVGAYEVRAAKAGFVEYVSERVNLTVNETATLDITLKVRGLEEEAVTVAPGMSAPLASFTSPASVLVVCACAAAAEKRRASARQVSLAQRG